MLNLFLILKIMLFSVWLIILRGTMPRYRLDQLLVNTWKDWIFVWLSFLLFLVISLLYFIF